MKKKMFMLLQGFIFVLSFFCLNTIVYAAMGEVTVTGQQNYDYAKEVVTKVNEERAKVGAPALIMDSTLTEAAMKRAQELAINFSHTRANGTDCFTILNDYNIRATDYGENIAFNYSTPTQVMDGWMQSEGHKENILNSNYTSIGIGYFTDGRFIYWVQLFGRGNTTTPMTKTGITAKQEYKVTIADDYLVIYMDSLLDDRIAPGDNGIYLGETKNLYYKNNQPYIVNIGLLESTEEINYSLVPIKATDVVFSSENTNLLKIDSGKVTGIASGKAVLKAKIGNIELKYNILIGSKVTTFEIESQKTVHVGETTEVLLNLLPDDAIFYNPEYEVDNEDLVDIEWYNDPVSSQQKAKITGKKTGTTTLTARIYDENGNITETKCLITVLETISIESISLNKENVILNVNGTEKLIAMITPETTTEDKTLTWSSADPSIVTVDASGNIKALKPGQTTITVQTSNGKTATASVKVLIPIDSIHVSNSNIILNVGENEKINYTIMPTNAEEEKTITWSSADETIATVDANGLITAKGKGTTTITGRTKTGVEVTITVKVEIPLTGINIKDAFVQMEKDTSKQLEVEYIPSTTTNTQEASWTSSDESIVTVDQTGKITAKNPGTAIITARIGEFTATSEVKVIVPIEGITLDKKEITLNKGSQTKVTAIVTPEDATDVKVIYRSLDSSIATVDENGLITAIGKGTTTITATVGSKQATVQVIVLVPIQSFELETEEINIRLDETYTLKAEITPETTTENTKIHWSTEDESIAVVNEQGAIKGLKEGTTKVVGTLENGMTVTASVTVYAIPITAIEVDKEEITLKVNDTEKINVKVYPENTTDKYTILYESSTPEVVTISNTGVLKALKPGHATIEIKVGDYKKKINIIVEDVLLEDIAISTKKNTLVIGGTTKIEVSSIPQNTTENFIIYYESSDEEIATIDEEGIVTAISPGIVTIKVKTSTGLEKEVELKVIASSSENTPKDPIQDEKEEEVTIPDTKVDGINGDTFLYISLLCLYILLMKKEVWTKQ